MSLLNAIVTRWAAVPALNSLVTAANVVLGDPILGWPIPALALTGYTRSKANRSSGGNHDQVALRVTIEAATAAKVEEITEAIREYLCPLTVGSQQLADCSGVTLDLGRDPTSQQYIGQATFTFHLW
jgi:hypothetical protein